MDHQEAVKNLRVIRKIMESSSRYTLLPGVPAIIGGCLVLAAAAYTWFVTRSLDLNELGSLVRRADVVIGAWAAAGLLALAIDIAWASALAFRRGLNPFGRMARVAAYALGPPFVAGLVVGLYKLAFADYSQVAAYSMIFYGLGLWAAALFSDRSPQLMGAAFLAAGLLTLVWLGPWSLAVAAVTFGGFHILFGAYVLARFGE